MSAHVVSTIVLIAHWSIIVVLSIRVIRRRTAVGVSLAWLAVIFSIPFAGAVVYLLFGEKRLGRHRAARAAAKVGDITAWLASLAERPDAVPPQVGSAGEPLQRHVRRVLGFPVLCGNEIDLLDDFQSIFDALVADIDAAERTCDLAFYIWHKGGRAGDVVDALVRAAGRGVRCRVMADAMGSKPFLKGDLPRRLREAGVALTVALPTGPLRTIFVRADLRNHRKIAVIDDRVAYTGSQNLVDPRYFKQGSGVGQWVDAMVRVTGPAAAALDGVFRFDWAVESGGAFEPPPAPDPGPPDGAEVQVVPSGPGLRPEAIHQLLLTALYAARRELVLTTPYFVPDESMLTALLSAALRGVEVTLIVPARNDSLLVRYASVAHFDDLLAAGVHLALYRGGLLHTKSLAIDGQVGIFGSVNLDMRSLWLNFEISLFVYGHRFTQRLRALQDRYLEDSDRLRLDDWRRRPARRRFAEDAIRLLGPLL
jgi:cardiolipin synthase